MKHVVIFAHPNPDSFTATMAKAYAGTARRRGHEVLVRDLYAQGFDPRLALEEIPGEHPPQPRADVSEERRLLVDAQVFVLVYPLWFNSPPAMLKGYIERVFGMGFGYGPGAGGSVPLLEDRKLISITSSGAPQAWVRDTGAWQALKLLFDDHFAAVCGLEVVDHLHSGEITPGMRTDAVDTCAAKVEALFDLHFKRLAAAAPT